MNRGGRNNGIYAAETILKRRVREVRRASNICCLVVEKSGLTNRVTALCFAGKGWIFHQMERVFSEVSIVHFTCIIYAECFWMLLCLSLLFSAQIQLDTILGNRKKMCLIQDCWERFDNGWLWGKAQIIFYAFRRVYFVSLSADYQHWAISST